MSQMLCAHFEHMLTARGASLDSLSGYCLGTHNNIQKTKRIMTCTRAARSYHGVSYLAERTGSAKPV